MFIELTEATSGGDIKRRIRPRWIISFFDSGTGLTALYLSNWPKNNRWISVRETSNYIKSKLRGGVMAEQIVIGKALINTKKKICLVYGKYRVGDVAIFPETKDGSIKGYIVFIPEKKFEPQSYSTDELYPEEDGDD